jgi:hypothetical protein
MIGKRPSAHGHVSYNARATLVQEIDAAKTARIDATTRKSLFSDDGCIDLVELAERLDEIAPKVGNLKGDRVVKVDPNDPVAVAKARAAIADRYDAWAKHKYEQRAAAIDLIAVLRIHELRRYLSLRYGDVLPDDDAGRQDLTILLNHIAQNRDEPGGRMLAVIQPWAPWMTSAEAEELVAMILKKPRKYTPGRLGELLRLTEAERELLKITTVRAIDETTDAGMSDDAMKAKRQREDREVKTAKRRSEGAVTREEYETKSKTRTEPWKQLNMSRSTYYRKLKAAELPSETGPSAALEENSYAADTLVSPEEPILLPALIIVDRRARQARRRPPDVIEILPVAEGEWLPEVKIVTPPQPADGVIDLVLLPKAPRVRRARARRPNHAERGMLWGQILYEQEQRAKRGDMR